MTTARIATKTKSSTNPTDHQETLVLKSAIFSRLLLLALTLFWRTILNPYDTSASLNPACLGNASTDLPQPLPVLPSLGSAIETGIVWDSVYYVRIAQCGYEYEQSYAFLPLLPTCIFIFSRTVFAPLVPVIGYRAVLTLSGYVICNVAFVLTAFYFYRLSVIILKDPNAAMRASILFCYNPASIFYSSIYSESVYALFSIGGLFYLIYGANNTAVFWFALSGLARSNGVLNAGYICYQTMHWAYDALFRKKCTILVLWILIRGALCCICIFLPFVAFQAYGYYNICLGQFVDEMSPWCKARIPLLYNYIQSHYWGVGFLRYFQLKQVPNFLLASPILCLALCSIIYFVKVCPELFLTLGFRASSAEGKGSAAVLFSFEATQISRDDNIPVNYSFRSQDIASQHENQDVRRRKQMRQEALADIRGDYEPLEKLGYLSAVVVPVSLHLGFMAATAFLVMHVQVATRFLSASPPLYWFASVLMMSPGISRRWGYVIWAYSAAYILVGSMLFSNFYPFT